MATHLQKSLKSVLATAAFAALANLCTYAANHKNITLGKIDGRHWFVSPEGKPFFAHGITHVGNRNANLDFQNFSQSCKELGFNAYGYGCPQPLRSDMPYVASWNHLIPISYYRGKNGIKFVDVFDPKVEARLEAGVKTYCKVNAKTSQNVSSVIAGPILDHGRWKTLQARTGSISSATCLETLRAEKPTNFFWKGGKAKVAKHAIRLSFASSPVNIFVSSEKLNENMPPATSYSETVSALTRWTRM